MKQPKDLAELIAIHPKPWSVGLSHESKAEIVDARYSSVFTVTTIFAPVYPETFAQIIVDLVNSQEG